ncbi:hypothetical protein R1flu_005989 [Riccia fluitans]|uniref:Uncharacterized protein n=1 Tax=Riccia fluitans TaxID=41844 RepID=A0ABD1YVK1_9MARC
MKFRRAMTDQHPLLIPEQRRDAFQPDTAVSARGHGVLLWLAVVPVPKGLVNMETPVRRMTRSQASSGPSSAVCLSPAKPPPRAASSTKKKGMSRRALSDLTNDSPISGLMPSGMAGSTGCVYESTPRSKLRPVDSTQGEDALRNQVTRLLKKVEGTGLAKASLLSELQRSADVFESPMRLAAPTPANTPATGSWPSAQESITVTLPEGRLQSTLRPSPPPIAIASPICPLEVCLPVDRSSNPEQIRIPPFRIGEVEPEVVVTNDRQFEAAQPTTRVLQFDSPEKEAEEVVLPVEECPRVQLFESPQQSVDISVEMSSPLPQAEEVILPSDECPRAQLFESPQKFFDVPVEMSSPFSQAEDEDDCGWSVIVNVNSPDTKVNSIAHEDFETVDFLSSAENPDIWARRATPKKEFDDEDYEDFEEYESFSEEFEDEESNEVSKEIDAACEELCKGISHISMGEGELKGLPEFQGKHIRFNYNSDDEIEEEIIKDRKVESPSKIKLKGCPTPKGKHLRFSDEQDDE